MENTTYQNKTRTRNTDTKKKLSSRTVYFIRNFLIIFNGIFTISILPLSVESLLWIHFIFTLRLFKAKKPNYQEATIHYISGFVLLVMLRLTLEQKVVNGLLSITPYAYYEMVLDRKKS